MDTNSTGIVRVLGIVGSPRVGGNTDILVDEALAGAREAGATSEKVYLSKLSIAPCRACEGCKTAGRCINDDDMQMLAARMDESAVWVMGTPVYFWGPTGWFKAFMDRWYGTREHVKFAEKSAVVLVPQEDTNLATARHTVGAIQDALAYLKTEVIATIVAPGVWKKGEIKALSDILAQARQAGHDAVEQRAKAG